MIVLGIDPGFASAATGGALLDLGGAAPRLIATYTLRARRGGAWHVRVDDILVQLHDLLRIEILPYYPSLLLGYELPHVEKNVQTALRLADLGGAVRGIGVVYGLSVVGVQPAESKVALTGDAGADKAAMVRAARVLFGRDLSEHEADAIGHALAAEAELRRARVVREAGR